MVEKEGGVVVVVVAVEVVEVVVEMTRWFCMQQRQRG